MNINRHPAPGLGEMMPGWFAVPQNPIVGVTYTPALGEIMPGSFPVPQNPVKDAVTGTTRMIGQQAGTGYGLGSGAADTINSTMAGLHGCGSGCGCGPCSGKLNGVGVSGISEDWGVISGDISAGNYMQVFKDTVFGIPVWGVLAAVVVLPMIMGGGGGRRRR